MCHQDHPAPSPHIISKGNVINLKTKVWAQTTSTMQKYALIYYFIHSVHIPFFQICHSLALEDFNGSHMIQGGRECETACVCVCQCVQDTCSSPPQGVNLDDVISSIWQRSLRHQKVQLLYRSPALRKNSGGGVITNHSRKKKQKKTDLQQRLGPPALAERDF